MSYDSGRLSPDGQVFVEDSQLSIPEGQIAGHSSVNKFGEAINVDGSTATDIWDGCADAPGAAQPIWLAPTAASIHKITSTSDADGKTDAPNSAGARTIRVYGLKTWDTAESSEDITLSGTDTDVFTANSYVIIHRMKVLTSGASGPNVGVIKATAAAGQGAKVTAEIRVGQGQTLMAIYGVPSTQTAYMTQLYSSVFRSVSSALADIGLWWCFDPKNNEDVFQIKHQSSISQTGQTVMNHPFNPYNGFAGPGILKLQATASANDVTVAGGFDLILVDN